VTDQERYLTVCPLGCTGELVETEIRLREGVLLRCTECGQLLSQCTAQRYWETMREFENPQGTLPKKGLEARRHRRSKKFLDTVRTLLDMPPEYIRLLDVGCSSGAFLKTATALGYCAQGVEPSAPAVRTAQEAGLDVRQGLLQDANYPAESFDVVTLFEVIEHLKEPQVLLTEIQRVLRPGGILLIGTGNAASWSAQVMGAQWEYFDIDRHGGHISFFSPQSLALLASRTGFEPVLLKTRSVRLMGVEHARTWAYRPAKIAGELLNPIAKLSHKGSDLTMYLKRR